MIISSILYIITLLPVLLLLLLSTLQQLRTQLSESGINRNKINEGKLEKAKIPIVLQKGEAYGLFWEAKNGRRRGPNGTDRKT